MTFYNQSVRSDPRTNIVTRFSLDVPLSLKLPGTCTCGGSICLPEGIGITLAEQELIRHEEREWFRHRLTCVKTSALRVTAHDTIARLWMAMLADAGFTDICYEPRRWDALATGDDAKHRRPDVLATNPITMVRWVLDFRLAWAESADVALPGLAAKMAEGFSGLQEPRLRRCHAAAGG